jgi:hypothetical protein
MSDLGLTYDLEEPLSDIILRQYWHTSVNTIVIILMSYVTNANRLHFGVRNVEVICGKLVAY